jgi:hypothetical protein
MPCRESGYLRAAGLSRQRLCRPCHRQIPRFSFGRVEMIVGPNVPQSAAGQCSSALPQYHERDAGDHRSARACPSACPEIHRTCSRCLPIESGFSVSSRALGEERLLVGSNRPSRNSADMRIIRQRRRATRRGARSTDHWNRLRSETRRDGRQGDTPSR